MTCDLVALSIDAHDPLRLARFWAGVLGWEMIDEPNGGFALLPSDDTGFRIEFFPTREQKAGPNWMHFHLTSTSLEDQQGTVARTLELGTRHIDVGQRPEEGHVVLADPEDNEWVTCVDGCQSSAGTGTSQRMEKSVPIPAIRTVGRTPIAPPSTPPATTTESPGNGFRASTRRWSRTGPAANGSIAIDRSEMYAHINHAAP